MNALVGEMLTAPVIVQRGLIYVKTVGKTMQWGSAEEREYVGGRVCLISICIWLALGSSMSGVRNREQDMNGAFNLHGWQWMQSE